MALIALSLTTIGVFSVFGAQVPVIGNQTITITNPVDGHTYEAYQLFVGDLTVDDTKASPTVDDYILSNIQWGNGITDAGKTALAGSQTAAAFAATITDARAFADAVQTYLQNPISFTNNQASVAPGYYLIKDQSSISSAWSFSLAQQSSL